MNFQRVTGEVMELTVDDGEHTVKGQSEKTVEKALHLPLSRRTGKAKPVENRQHAL